MNIFLPYEDDVIKSVQSLDGVRLNKQILECYQLYKNAYDEYYCDREVKGYKNHPIYVFYKSNVCFLAYYGLQCCREYFKRFSKPHKLGCRIFHKDLMKYSKENNCQYNTNKITKYWY